MPVYPFFLNQLKVDGSEHESIATAEQEGDRSTFGGEQEAILYGLVSASSREEALVVLQGVFPCPPWPKAVLSLVRCYGYVIVQALLIESAGQGHMRVRWRIKGRLVAS